MPSTPPPPSSYSFPQSPPPAASRRSYSPPSGGGVSSPLLANANAPLSSPPPLINLSPSPPRTRHEARSLLLPETSSDSSFESQERRRASSAEEGGGGSGGGGSRASNGSDEDGAATRLDSTGSSTGAPTLSSFSKEDFNPGPTSASNRNSAITFSKVEAPWMADQQRANRMSGMSYSSSQGSLSPPSVPKGLHSPSTLRRDSSTIDFRTSLMRPMSYASQIGFDPDPESGGGPTPDTYEDGPETDDWMYEKEEDEGQVEEGGKKRAAWQEQSTSYGNGRGFVYLRAANLFCLLFIVLALIVLFIAYPILDKTVLHRGLAGGHYQKEPVARPAGTYTGSENVPAPAATVTGDGLFGRRHY